MAHFIAFSNGVWVVTGIVSHNTQTVHAAPMFVFSSGTEDLFLRGVLDECSLNTGITGKSLIAEFSVSDIFF